MSFRIGTTVCIFLLCIDSRAEEMHANIIISDIINTQQAILAKLAGSSPQECIFLTFWDFDGTILMGDCSEGMKTEGRTVYKGLLQLAIEAGYSKIYQPENGFDRFWKDYRHLESNIGEWLAYPFLPQMLRGAKAGDVSLLANRHFKDILKQYYFKSSIEVLESLEQAGIENHIISACSDIFVNEAASTLKLPQERFNGIQVQIEGGRLTEKLVYPVTWAEGKAEKLQMIVSRIQDRNPNKRVIALAAFGNSYSSDGPFMKYVATQTLPAGKPLAVMINGGKAPDIYHDMFIQVQQSEIIGAKQSLETSP